MDIQCNGIGGIMAWTCVIALFWFALCLPFPKMSGVLKVLVILTFAYVVFFYAMR